MAKLFILGAGFSRYAGLPLGGELFKAVLRQSKEITDKGHKGILYENILARDIGRFLRFKERTQGVKLTEENIDAEEFMSFLDVEHFLRFKGGDVYSEEADRSQQIVKNLIAKTLLEKQAEITEDQWAFYYKFAAKLRPNDLILTFNYDTILEQSLEQVGIPYRLVGNKYKSISAGGSGVLETNDKDVIVLKLHGSIDWFDIASFERRAKYFAELPDPKPKNFHPIFSNKPTFRPTPIIGEPYPEDSLLRRIYRVQNLSEYFPVADYVIEAPLMLAPSYQKLLYSDPLKDLWWGMGNTGGLTEMLAIIGFSLPAHDQYILQAIYQIVRNFQHVETGDMIKKTALRFVDFCPNDEVIKALMNRYAFADWDKTELETGGFRPEALAFLFSET